MPMMIWRGVGLTLVVLYFFAGGIAHLLFGGAVSSRIYRMTTGLNRTP